MEKKIQIAGLTNAITDIIINVSYSELNRLGIKKGFHNSKENIPYLEFLKLIEKPCVHATGGSTGNVIIGAANLGVTTALFGTVGDDSYGEEYIKEIESKGINSLINIEKGESGLCYLFITPDGEKTSISAMGVAGRYNFDLFQLKEAEIFHTSGYELMTNPSRVKETLEYAKTIGAKLSFDLSDPSAIIRQRENIEDILKSTHILFATEEEALELDYEISELCPIAILKKGERGSIVMQGKNKFVIPIYKVEVQGTNGAGDAYSAGFLAEYLKGSNLEACGHAGSSYAAKICSIKESHL
ncbi:adenosine kinase [Candidatus Pacearchaeota archaeon]|nr:adenosine kinase [Candidatus Pacearchaeota archaeon]